MLRKLIPILFLLVHFTINSQELIFERPSNLLSLPSNECYNIIQDKTGYIWFSTDAGLCKYNGNKVKLFSKKEGLTEESCYGSVCDKQGNIIVITSENRLLRIVDDKIHELPISKAFSKELNQMQLHSTDFKIVSDSLLIVNTQISTFQVNLVKNTFRRIIKDPKNGDFQIALNGVNIYSIKNPILDIEKYRSKRSPIFPITILYKDQKKLTIPFTDSLNFTGSFLTIKCITDKKGNLFISLGTALLKIDKNGLQESYNLKDGIVTIYLDKKENLWVGQRNLGLSFYQDGIISITQKKYALNKMTVTGIVEANNGSIWCTTLEKGVFCCQNTNITKISNLTTSTNTSTLFKTDNSQLLFNSTSNTLIKTNGIKIKEFGVVSGNKSIFSDVLHHNDEIYLSSNYGIFKTDSTFRNSKPINLKNAPFHYVGSQIAICEGRIFGINSTALFEISDQIIYERVPNFKSKLKSIFSHENKLFIATEDGIYLVDLKDYKFNLIKQIKSLKEAQINKKGETVILSKSEGIWALTNNSKLNYRFNEISNLKINDFKLTDSSEIWISTNKGIIKIPDIDSTPILMFDSRFGFPNLNYKKIDCTNEDLFVSTEEEIFHIKLPINSSFTSKNKLFLKQIQLNDQTVDSSELKNLKFTQNNFRITIENLNYGNRIDGNKLFYQLEGYSSNKSYTIDNEINFTDIPPGEYTLKIYSNSDPKAEDYQVLSFTININKPFWKQWWFLTLVGLLIGSTIFILVRKYIKRVRLKDQKTAEINNLLNSYQMAAIRAQMNPHFVFNCINSIQRYIITNDSKSAYDYLTKFSKLIRAVLNHSEEDMISLEQELEVVRLYVQMEQLRFENVFTYEVTIDGSIEEGDFLMPPMMLQPYIENSIWHGIMHLDKSVNGKISISISSEEKTLIVVIEDNGVGREQSKKLVVRQHKSKAISLNEKRIQVLNSINQSIMGSIKIEDVLDTNNTVKGTKVTIIIPQPNE
ncbi:MAG: histidine kinase [Bacteroidota bacterium]|nr:histidine kinase [Bacteroidota bacterium]